ncbi:MAG: RecJ-like exonuclease [Kiritimatiellia bacterium]|jgi:RecJ-like exonuclease
MAYGMRKRKNETKGMTMLLVVTLLAIAGYMQVDWMRENKVEVVKSHPTQKIPCPHCEGKGHLPNPEEIPNHMDCPYCFGVGFRYIRRLGTSLTICPNCIGIGRELYESGGYVEECQTCRGFGVMKKAYEGVKYVEEIEEYYVEQKFDAAPPATNRVEESPESELRPF